MMMPVEQAMLYDAMLTLPSTCVIVKRAPRPISRLHVRTVPGK